MFSDVNKDTSYAGEIQMISQSGVMVGFDDGSFRPDESVTYTQAVITILRIAGYDYMAESYGGYPSGYLAVAAEAGLNGVYGADSALTWEMATELFYEALFIEVMSLEDVSDENFSIEISESTILEKFFGLIKGRGTVTASEYISVLGTEKAFPETVVISDKNASWILNAGKTGIENFVGYSVTYFYDEEDEIFAFEINEEKMQTVTISEKGFLSINENFTLLEYELEDSKRSKKVKIDVNADFVYNGVSCYEIAMSDFENADEIKLLDYDSDGIYELVYITVYEVYLVGSVSLKTGIVSDKRDGRYLIIDENEYDVTYIKSGIETEIGIISEWDVLNVAVSRSQNKMKIVIVSDIIAGKVTKKSEEEREIQLDNKMSYYVSKKIDISKLNLGDNIIFGLNEKGEFVCYKRDTSDEKQYAYLLRIISEMGDLDYELSIKVINIDGKTERIPIAEKFYINNERGSWNGLKFIATVNDLENLPEGNFKAKHQLISYITDKDNKVKRIFFADEEVGSTEPESSNSLQLNKKFSGLRFWEAGGCINNEYLFDTSTRYFKIITDSSGDVIEELSTTFALGSSKIQGGSRPDVYVYDADESRIAKAMVISIPLNTLLDYASFDTQALVVASIDDVCIGSDVVKNISGYQSGKAVDLCAEETLNTDDWKNGDVFIITKSVNGKIMSARKLFSMNDDTGAVLSPVKTYSDTYKSVREFTKDTSASAETKNFSESITGAYGIIQEVINTADLQAIRVKLIGSDQEIIYRIQSSTGLYVYCSKRGKVDTLTLDNLSVGIGSGKVFIYSRYQYARDILVIE